MGECVRSDAVGARCDGQVRAGGVSLEVVLLQHRKADLVRALLHHWHALLRNLERVDGVARGLLGLFGVRASHVVLLLVPHAHRLVLVHPLVSARKDDPRLGFLPPLNETLVCGSAYRVCAACLLLFS